MNIIVEVSAKSANQCCSWLCCELCDRIMHFRHIVNEIKCVDNFIEHLMKCIGGIPLCGLKILCFVECEARKRK